MGQITVFSGPERRRRWSDEQRLEILAEAFAPGACASEVARRHEISTGQLYTWRSKLAAGAATPASDNGAVAGFAAVVIDGEPPLSGSGTAIIVDLPRGRRMTIFPGASAVLVAAALKALR